MMDEDTWIRNNIKQRKCVLFCKLSDGYPNGCKCYQAKSSHPGSDTKKTDIWSLTKNTVTEPSQHFGEICYDRTTTSKFVRIDVETETSTTETLLLDVWKLPTPKWIISVVGEEHLSAEERKKIEDAQESKSTKGRLKKEKELVFQLKHALKYFADGQNVWITTEGINFGLAKVVGEAIKKKQQDIATMANVTSVGVYGWGICDDGAIEALSSIKVLPKHEPGNRPSYLFPHHLLVDDGTENPVFNHQSFQNFRINMETSLANLSDIDSSIPLVMLLYGGWSYVIDAVKMAVDEDVPIVVLQGSGGFAEVLANVFNASKEDHLSSTNSDTWTGTVIDDQLREEVASQFKAVHGKGYPAGQHTILQCLQKRELITIVDIDKQEDTLVSAILEAVLKSKSVHEILRMVDCYMPARLFEGEGTAGAALKGVTNETRDIFETASLILRQSLMLDQAHVVQFILDYDGVDLVDFVQNKFQSEVKPNSVLNIQSDDGNSKDVAIKSLYNWAIETGKWKCASLFWKKGKHQLACALWTTKLLREKQNSDKNEGQKKVLGKNAILFGDRAKGLIDTCYRDNIENTMDLIQAQAQHNVWDTDLLLDCFSQDNRKIFATEAFREYVKRVWHGTTKPPYKDDIFRRSRRMFIPVVKYVLNLLCYLLFVGIFGHTLLFELGPSVHPLEIVLLAWWVTFIWEETTVILSTQVNKKWTEDYSAKTCCTPHCERLRSYFSDNYWNILRFLSLLFFLIGGLLLLVFHLDSRNTRVYEAARVFLSLDLMMFTWRILQYLAIFDILGVVLEMIYRMVKDLFPFLVIMFVFIISQGLAAHSLLYPARDWTAESLLDIPKASFWNIFGELGLDDIEASAFQNKCSTDPELYENDLTDECPSTLGRYLVPFLLGMHMLLMNVLLLNMLIAKFSFTFQEVHEQTTWLAAWQKARVTFDFYRRPPFPPPLNVIHVFELIYSLLYRCKNNKVASKDNIPIKYDEGLISWERSKAEFHLASEFTSGSERISMSRNTKNKPRDAHNTLRKGGMNPDHHIIMNAEKDSQATSYSSTDMKLSQIISAVSSLGKDMATLGERMTRLEHLTRSLKTVDDQQDLYHAIQHRQQPNRVESDLEMHNIDDAGSETSA